MSETTNITLSETVSGADNGRLRLVAAGGILGAIGATTCCIMPLVLFSLGASGAWIGQMTALAPFQPYIIAVTVGFLGYGYWLVYRKPKVACAEGEACPRPVSNTLVKSALLLSTAVVALALAWPWVVPVLLG